MSQGQYQATSPTARTGRKTLKYKRSEPVWSLDLEEALLQGLSEYRPSSTRDPSLLRRFPRRNKWISNYIFQRTGKTRTAKQVGSRLQQLRETCSDTEILGLIVNKSFPVHGSPQSSVYGGSSLPSSATSTPTTSSFPIISHPPLTQQNFTEVAVSLVLHESDPYYGAKAPTVTLDLDESGFTDVAFLNSNSFVRRAEIRSIGRLCQSPPEIKFSSQSLQNINCRYRSVCSVYCGDELFYTDEDSNLFLQLAYFDDNSQTVLYSHKLVPEFWSHMSSDPKDYCQYRITQRIFSTGTAADTSHEEQLLFSIDYFVEASSLLVPSAYETHELPPSMAITPFLPNYQYDSLTADLYDYELLPNAVAYDQLSYPQFSAYGVLPNQPQSFHYSTM